MDDLKVVHWETSTIANLKPDQYCFRYVIKPASSPTGYLYWFSVTQLISTSMLLILFMVVQIPPEVQIKQQKKKEMHKFSEIKCSAAATN